MRLRAHPKRSRSVGFVRLRGWTLGPGQVELPTGDERVGGTQIAVHDGHIGREVAEIGAVGAVQEVVEASAVVVVAFDEESGLLVGGSAESAASSMADAGAARSVPRRVVMDLGAGEFDEGPGIIVEREVADDAEGSGRCRRARIRE